MRINSLHLIIILISTLVAIPGWADEDKSVDYAAMSLDDLLEVNIESATKRPQEVGKVPATVYVYTQHDFATYGFRNLQDVLKHTPGIEYGNPGSWLQGGQRGFAGSWTQTKLLINGLETNLLWSGEAYIADQFPLYNVKRVEIIQGPASALYGADAFVGLINIVTKDASNTSDEINIETTLGSRNKTFDNREVGVNVVKQTNKIGYSVNAFYLDKAGYDFTDYVKSTQFSQRNVAERRSLLSDGSNPYLDKDKAVNANLDLRFGDESTGSLNIGTYYLRNVDGGGHENPELSFTGFNDTREQLHFYGRYRHYFRGKLYKLGLEYHRMQEDDRVSYQSRSDTSVLPPPVLEYIVDGSTLDKFTMQLDADLDWLDNYLIFGASTQEVKIGAPEAPFADPALIPFLEQDKKSLFLQDQQLFLDSRLQITAGIRFDDHNIYGMVDTARGGVRYEFNDKYAVKLLYGEAFREPTVYELSTNAFLNPSKIRTSEVALQFANLPHMTGQVSYYYSRAFEVIQEQRGGINKNFNQGVLKSQGVESLVKLHYGKAEGHLWYCLTDGANDENVATHKIGLGAAYKISEQTSLSLLGKYTSTIDTQAMDSLDNIYMVTVPEYLSFDCTVLARGMVIPDTSLTLDLSASVYNIFDRSNYFANVRGTDPIMYMDEPRTLFIKGVVRF